MINKLKSIAEKYIEINKNNPTELKKYKLIRQILNKKNCFLNMDIDYAYSILNDLHIPENEIKDVYMGLIDLNESEII